MCIYQDVHDTLSLKSQDAVWYAEYDPALITI